MISLTQYNIIFIEHGVGGNGFPLYVVVLAVLEDIIWIIIKQKHTNNIIIFYIF